MAPQYSEALRLRILEEAIAVNYDLAKIVKNLTERGHQVSKNGVRGFLTHYAETTSIGRKQGSGRPRKIDSEALAIIDREMERNNETTAIDLQKVLADESKLQVSHRTVSRNRASLGWVYGQTRYCQAISHENVDVRYQWALKMQEKLAAGYTFENVVFTDEAKVELMQHKTRSCRKIGHKVQLKGLHKHPASVLVWAGISRRGPTQILVFSGCMDAEFYVNEILNNTLMPFATKTFETIDELVFMQDNDPKHVSNLAINYMSQNGIKWRRTPAQSPDINPIEKIWAEMKAYLKKYIKPRTVQELEEGIQLFWDTVTPEKCCRYINHLQKAIPKIVESKGLPTGE